MENKKYDVVINGRVMTKPLNGIPRFSYELTSGIDALNPNDLKICVVLPVGSHIDGEFKNIDIIYLKNKKMWDFFSAEKFAKKQKALYITLASKGSLYKNSIALVYDVRPLRLKKSEKAISTLKFKISFKLACKNSKKIVTISDFCKKEIESLTKRRDIEVIGSGWDHLKKIQSDDSIFQEYPAIKPKQYVLSVGSIAPHKNFKWVINAASMNKDKTFVIVGSANPKLWDEKIETRNNLIWLGFQSDERLKSLMSNASVFLFPSIYEGFGIPPLEALSLSCECAVMDIPVTREIFKNSVLYLNNDNFVVPSVEEVKNAADPKTKEQVLSEYTWRNSAMKFIEIIRSAKNG